MKLLISTCLLVLAAQDAKVELRWKYTKGQEIRYKTIQRVTMDAAGAKVRQETTTTFSMNVTNGDPKGEATILAKYEAVGVQMSGLQELDYDSEKDKEVPEDPQVQMLAKLVGQSFTMKMTASGKVVEVKGFDKILEAMTKGAGEKEGQEQAQMMLKQMFSDESFKSMMQQMSPPLPEDKVGKGDTWSNDFTMKLPFLGGMKFGIKSKLDDLNERTATIQQDLKIELKGEGEDKDNPLAGVIEIKDAKGKSTAIFSIERGLFLSQKATMDMTLSASGQDMPIKTETELKLVEKAKKNF